MVSISAIVLNGVKTPIEKYTLECLRSFDEVITCDKETSDYARLRNELIDSCRSEYFFFLDNDEIVSKEIYEHLTDLFRLYRDVVVVFPRINTQTFGKYYSTRFPDYQARAGRKGIHEYSKQVHETIASQYYIYSNYPIVHYGNCIEKFNLDKLRTLQTKFSKLGYSLYEELKVNDFEELIKVLSSLPSKSLDDIESYIKINIPFDIIKTIETKLRREENESSNQTDKF